MIGGRIISEPFIKKNKIYKGAVILMGGDNCVKKIPLLKKYFYIIEWRGWEGMNDQKSSDIKLVEDFSTWEKTKKVFPNAKLLNLGPADFVDTDIFKPLKKEKKYCGVQISRWDRFKRQKLFIEGTSLFKNKKFILFGHFANGGDPLELELKMKTIRLINLKNAPVDMPYKHLKTNEELPKNGEIINDYINQSQIGILTTKVEGINRFTLECMSAGIPMLVPNDTGYPPTKHINHLTGVLYEPTPKGLKDAINYTLNNYSSFSPRQYILDNTGKNRSSKILLKALNELVIENGYPSYFKNIDWDGRNQSMSWDANMINDLNMSIKNIKHIFKFKKEENYNIE